MRILAIDPGTTDTGWCIYDTEKHEVTHKGIANNQEFKKTIMDTHGMHFDDVACEMIASYGMPVGREVFETCVFIGNLQQLAEYYEKSFTLVYRKDVKIELCGTMKAKDGNIRQAIIDEFPGTGEGSIPQIGNKKKPGPLYGVSSHVWPALGVGITHAKQSNVYKINSNESR